MALVLFLHENLGKDKHVESLWFPRLDEGSIPSSSTRYKKLTGSIKNLRVFLFAENLFIKKKTKTFGY